MSAAFDQRSLLYERGILMENIRQYLLSLIASAIICSVVISIIGNKNTLSPVIKLLAGLFIIYTALAPWAKLRLDGLLSYFDDLKLEASVSVSKGSNSAVQATASIIKNQTEAYILDKASSMGAEITVEVIVQETTPPTPCYVEIEGTLAPYHKQRLEQVVINELGIPKENLSWT